MPSSSAKKTRDLRQLELPTVALADEGGNVDADTLARAANIVASLPTLDGEEVFAAFEELDQLPTPAVQAALAPYGPPPDPEHLDDTLRLAHGFPPRPLRLRTIALVRDADIFDLGETAEEQVRIAGKTYDGLELAAEERLDGENEASFAGTLEHRVLALADSADVVPVYDVLLFADDAGAIFRAGTTELVGAVAGNAVEMRERRARVAVQAALAVPVDEAALAPPSVDGEAIAPVAAAAQEVVSAPAAPVERASKKTRAAAKKPAAVKSKAPASKKAPASATKPASKTKATPKKKATATKKTTATKTKAPASTKKATATKKAAATKPKAAAKKPASPKTAKKSSVSTKKTATAKKKLAAKKKSAR